MRSDFLSELTKKSFITVITADAGPDKISIICFGRILLNVNQGIMKIQL